MVKARILITAVVTWVVFSIEAYVHYSYGKGKWEALSATETLKLLGTVALFSLLSAALATTIIAVTQPPPKKGKIIKKLEKQYDKIKK